MGAALAEAVCAFRLAGRRRDLRAQGRATCGSAAAASADFSQRCSFFIFGPQISRNRRRVWNNLMRLCGSLAGFAGIHCGRIFGIVPDLTTINGQSRITDTSRP